MDRRLTLPAFGRAPTAYDPMYFNDMVRMLNQMTVALRSAGEGRQTTLVLTNLPTNDAGAELGTLFQVNGTLYVSVPYRAYVAGNAAKGSVGTVTVTV